MKVDREIRDYYFDFLAREFPALVPRYEALYGERNHPSREYERELDDRVARVRRRYRFLERPPRVREPERDAAQLQLAM